MTSRSAAALSVLAMLAVSSLSLGASNRISELMARARADAAARPARVAVSASELPDFGATSVTINVGAYDFQAMSSNGDVVADDGNGYRYLTASTSGGYMGAVLQLPAGAMIDELGVNACTGATGDLTVGLFDDGILGNPASLLGSLTTTTHGVCFFQTVGQINHLYDHAFQHPLQLVVHLNGPMDGALKFNHVFVQYHLTVSPPPGVATFGDVPTSHPFFQFVEALAASGITAGCGNGNFCPDQPLTRGQMAVFLSKALGLNWPN